MHFAGPFSTYKFGSGGKCPLVLEVACLVSGVYPRNYPFFQKPYIRNEEIALNKSTVAQTGTVSGKYEKWECLLRLLEGCFL